MSIQGLLLFSFFSFCLRPIHGNYDNWLPAHATFYTRNLVEMGGACGYGDVEKAGYTVFTAALSYALFKQGLTCGACYELKCDDDPQWCKPQATVTISATNSCPPNLSLSNTNGGWCNEPLQHFDLSGQAFDQIVKAERAGIVPVQYRRVTCQKKGYVTFTFTLKDYVSLMLITNVGGVGDVIAVSVKGQPVSRTWGQHWIVEQTLQGQAFSVQVTTSDGKSVTANIPQNWKFGETVVSNVQF